MTRPVVGRFAPSPSGYMHLGNLLAMLLAWLDCRSQNGEMVFRLEDLDPARSKRVYAEAMAADLRWLGLDWDRGVGADRDLRDRLSDASGAGPGLPLLVHPQRTPRRRLRAPSGGAGI